MMINDSKQFREIIPLKSSILSIDLGKKRTGIAVSDINQKIASPLKVIENMKFNEILNILEKIVNERNICAIVVGDPINMDGSIGPKSQSSRSFIKNLSKELDIPILLWDERLTTVSAERSLLEADISRKKRQQIIDKIAASIILQNFLDYLNTKQ
jgi:putative Holliday junction resolvase